MGDRYEKSNRDKWEIQETASGWRWWLLDSDGNVVGKSVDFFVTRQLCVENAIRHRMSQYPDRDENPDALGMPALDEEALRSDIRLIEASHAGKEHAFSAGFHEGYGSAYRPDLGNSDPQRRGFVYIVTSARNGILFVKVTSDLPRRLFEHRTTRMPGVTVYQGVEILVWYEVYDQLIEAVERHKAIQKMPRQRKIDLVEALNPDWDDLSHRLLSS